MGATCNSCGCADIKDNQDTLSLSILHDIDDLKPQKELNFESHKLHIVQIDDEKDEETLKKYEGQENDVVDYATVDPATATNETMEEPQSGQKQIKHIQTPKETPVEILMRQQMLVVRI